MSNPSPELDLLSRKLHAGGAGAGSVAVISGEAGIGKTRLLGQLGWAADSLGFKVLSARCNDLEIDHSFGVVRQLLEGAVTEAERGGHQVFAQGAEHAIPIFRSDVPGEDHAARADVRFSRDQGLYWLTANIAETFGPMVWLVDDAQWADDASLEFLVFLSVRLDSLPLQVTCTTRLDPRPVAARAIDAFRRSEGYLEVAPTGLDSAGVFDLMTAHAPSTTPALADTCLEMTKGNPLMVLALARSLADRGLSDEREAEAFLRRAGPREVRDRVIGSLQAEPAVDRLATAIAVLGDDVPASLAAEFAGLDAAEADAATALLTTAKVLEEGPNDTLRFVHPIVRSTVYASMTVLRRRERHAEAAALLFDRQADVERVGAHLLRCDPLGNDWVVGTLLAAGTRALELGSPSSAAAYLERALEEPGDIEERAVVLRRLALAQAMGGDENALETHRHALEAADGAERIAIALDYASALAFSSRPVEAFAVLTGEDYGLRDSASADLEAARYASALFLLSSTGVAYRDRRRPALERMLATRAADLSAAERLIAGCCGFDRAVRGEDREQSSELARRAVSGPGLPLAVAAGPAWGFALWLLIMLEDYAGAMAVLAPALVESRRRGSVLEEALVLLFHGIVHLRRSDLREAESVATQSLELAALPGWSFGRSTATTYLVESLVEQGRLEAARECVDRLSAQELQPESIVYNVFLHTRALLRLAEGDVDGATDDLLGVGERMEAWRGIHPGFIPWRSSTALCLARGGELERGRKLAQAEVAVTGAFGCQRELSVALRAEALCCEARDDQLALLEQSVAAARGADAVLVLAKALASLGAAQRRDGQRSVARETLSQALTCASRCGAGLLVGEIQEELLAAGARPRRLETEGVASLTNAERRVAALAAEGCTNREIAQVLYVTVKTVEMHLANAYRKLDINSRTQLPAVLGSVEGSLVNRRAEQLGRLPAGAQHVR